MWICVKQICLCAMLLYLILKHTGSIAEVFKTTQLYTNEGRGKNDKTLKKDKFCMFSSSERINCSATSFKSLGTNTRHRNLQIITIFSVLSRCKTRIGNQLSSYAAILYFQQTYNMAGIMDSFQMNILQSIFNTAASSVSTIDLSSCCRPAHWKKWKR